MPFSSGTFSRIYNWVNEQLSSPIEISKLDAQEEDFATALSNCLLRDGTGLPTAAQDWNGQNLTNVAAFTATGIVTGGRFVPTSSSAPTNGMYLPAANTPALASNSTLRWSVNSLGNHGFLAPTSGVAVAVTGVAGGTSQTWTDGTRTATLNHSASRIDFGASTGDTLGLLTGGSRRVEIGSAGNVTVNAPSSSTTLLLNSLNGAVAYAAQCASAVNTLNTGYGVGLIAGLWNFYTAGADGLAIGTGGNAGTFIYTNSTQRVQVASAGNVTINTPSSGITLALSGVASGTSQTWTDGTVTAAVSFSSSITTFGSSSNHATRLISNGAERLLVAAAGNVTINAPSSGATLITTTGASLVGQRWTDGTRTLEVQQDSSANYFGTPGAQELRFFTNSLSRITIGSNGAVTVVAPTSGVGLTVAGGGASITGELSVSGGVTASFTGDGSAITALNATQLTSGTVASARISGSYTGITAIGTSCTIDGVTVGFRSVPRSTTTTTAATTDVGKCIAASAGITIPNATFAAGDCLSIYNDSASSITITQGASLTLRLAGTTTTGNLTLQPRGMATVWFNTASEAIASGSGLG